MYIVSEYTVASYAINGFSATLFAHVVNISFGIYISPITLEVVCCSSTIIPFTMH